MPILSERHLIVVPDIKQVMPLKDREGFQQAFLPCKPIPTMAVTYEDCAHGNSTATCFWFVLRCSLATDFLPGPCQQRRNCTDSDAVVILRGFSQLFPTDEV